jgi:hypothetical protein
MMERENIRKELEDIAPGLARLEKDNVFKVPGDYFETLPQHIQQKINSDTGKNSINWVFSRIPAMVFSTLTAVVFLVAGYFFLLNSSGETTGGLAVDSLFEDHLAYYSEYQPYIYLDMVLSAGHVAEDQNLTESRDEHLIDYLVDYEFFFMDQVRTENNASQQ